MVERQLRRRGIYDERVLGAMLEVPRELFVPAELRREVGANHQREGEHRQQHVHGLSYAAPRRADATPGASASVTTPCPSRPARLR